MATHNPIVGPPAAVPSRPSWAPLAAAVAVTAGFAALAFRLSFASLTTLAAEHGVAPDIVWMFAVLVDGGAVVGTVGVIAARRAGRPTAPYWATVIAFAVTSLCFNVSHSDGTGAGAAIAVVPPVAQLVATELLVRMLPTPETVAADDIAPAVAAATDAVQRAQDAADAARTSADTAQAAAEAAATTAARAEQAAAALTTTTTTTTAAPPLALVDLAAAVAAVEAPPVLDDALDDAPAPLPLAATFTAPPLPTPAPPDDVLDDGAPADAAAPDAPPAAAIAAYRRIRRETGARPTAEVLGAALGVKRTRGGELRRMVEQALGTPVATVIKS
ncbi:DUF2637 domain-containing protein [Streptomyces orinoci]|uniref:DUF2637 domain-containing protein n=1 Tax=Streptomyces orinoci TaxID=67339 RepID=A0ABV3K2W7_STRON|nr:DUF2637 domain-containing protein [Streptomyces orinoci]